ncbi:MAG: hypothetical protein KJI71_01720 [Patescibacteria group bacterium]|nr:hypothetical protein [Patescibacteria group bacterium]
MKTHKSKSFFFLILFFCSSLILFIPIVHAVGDDVYLISNDIIKNFKFESFDGNPVGLSGQTNDQKLQFESQASWRINPNDIQLVNIFTQGDDVYIRYKVGMTSKINMYTTVEINQGAENNLLNRITEDFLVAEYQHSGLFGHRMFGWEAYLHWTHYDFGNVKQWNSIHNDFGGDLVMSFDIAQSPLPNFQTLSGDSLTKSFDYVAVSSIGVVDNLYGKLDDSLPDIVGLTPRKYEEKKNILSPLDSFGGTAGNKWNAYYDPDINLNILSDFSDSFDGGIMPQSAGSSMNPRTKSGSPIWDPKLQQSSMTDARFIYNLGSISPVVMEYSATLSYTYLYYETVDEPFWQIGTKRNEPQDYSHTRPIALHVTNRYIQSEVKVVFDIFTSYKIDVGADGIEDYNLDFPMEYYDLLTWLTTVDGFGGGQQHTETPGLDWLNPFGIGWLPIIIILGVIIGGYLFIKIGGPIIRGRQRRNEIREIMRGSKRR